MTVQPGNLIEYREAAVGVFGGRLVQATVTRLQRDPVTGDVIPVVALGGGRDWPVAEFADSGRIVTLEPWFRGKMK